MKPCPFCKAKMSLIDPVKVGDMYTECMACVNPNCFIYNEKAIDCAGRVVMFIETFDGMNGRLASWGLVRVPSVEIPDIIRDLQKYNYEQVEFIDGPRPRNIAIENVKLIGGDLLKFISDQFYVTQLEN